LRLHLALLHNDDAEHLADDPGREARKDVECVAKALAEALGGRGHHVRVIPAGADLKFLAALREGPTDLVVNLCESLAGDSRGEMVIPGLLEMLGIPYTGSAALSLGLALHKDRAKQILKGHGVSTPLSAVIERLDQIDQIDDLELPYPLIVKPAREDASTCIDFDSVVDDKPGLIRAVDRVLRTLHQPALVEQYIAGQEIYVPILGNSPRRALPLTEILYGAFFDARPQIVSYKAKWDAESPDWQSMTVGLARLDAATEARCIRTAFAAFDALGCRDYGRVDLRVSADGTPYVIDINPNCDLNPTAGFSNAARTAGLSYADLAETIVRAALERTGSTPRPHAATHLKAAPSAVPRDLSYAS
jgi:D-alanine-D-alanine ligase